MTLHERHIDADRPIAEGDVLRRWVCLSAARLKRARKDQEIAWVRGPRGTPWYRPSMVEAFITQFLDSKGPRQKPTQQEPGGFVYFIRSGINGQIKIGYSASPWKRMANLATAHPGPLDLLAQFQGSVFDERDLHERFAASRITGEWFEPTPALLALIRQHGGRP